MFAPRGRAFVSHSITTKALIAIVLSLIVGMILSLFTFPRALASTLVSDNFNDNSLDTSKWDGNNLFSGFTNNSKKPSATTLHEIFETIGALLRKSKYLRRFTMREIADSNEIGPFARAIIHSITIREI